MAVALAPKYLVRYKDLARLLMKYARSDLFKNAGLFDETDEPTDEEGDSPYQSKAADLADDLEKLGPTYIKLGQLLSTRSDLLPEQYLESLSRLQDSVDPFPYEEVEEILTRELAARPSKAFAWFEETPLAAASLGQVHRATLRDGRDVVVKVQRPGIKETIKNDIEALTEIARFLDVHTDAGRKFHFEELIEQFGRTLARELDYRREAANLKLFRANLKEFQNILVPAPIDDYVTEHVLTMERVIGHNISKLNPVVHLEINGDELCDELFHAYLKQIFVDGMFHADPHPGNVFLTEDGRVALIDLGMIGYVAPLMRDKLLKLVIAIAEGEGDKAAETALDIGVAVAEFDRAAFSRDVGEFVAMQRNQTVENMDVGRVVLEITRISGKHGVRQPPEIALLGKALLNLHIIAETLEPAFDPSAAVRKRTGEILRRRMLKAASPGNLFSNVLELNEFVQQLPGRVNRLLDRVSDNQFEVRVNAIDEDKLISGLEKIANRITLGLILAALIVGAAMLMQIDTGFRLFGYPGLPILFFLGAAVGGLWLVRSIIAHDRGGGKK